MSRSKYDGPPIRRFLELRAAEGDLKPSDRSAALQVAREQEAPNREAYMEGLRKRYRVLKGRGELPPAHQQQIRDASMRKRLERAYASKETAIKESQKRYRYLEPQARNLGIKGDSEALGAQKSELDRRKRQLERLTSPSEIGVAILMERKHDSADSAYKDYQQLVRELSDVHYRLELVSELLEHTQFLEAIGKIPSHILEARRKLPQTGET